MNGWSRAALVAILALFAVLSVVGISWGLPSRNMDRFLFGDQEPWSGEKILRLTGAAARFSPTLGADVDVDPLIGRQGGPVPLTDTEADVAKIYLRYRLFTNQPDEMIAMMALSGMNPREGQFDPRLYQYGGLFLYPVGAGLFLGDLLGLIDVRSDVTFYLDHPEAFARFYIVSRGYAAAWGMIGVLIVFAIGRRLGGVGAGLAASLLFTLMPVVVCMAHEGKPHLPGAVLMLAAVLLGIRQLDERGKARALGQDADIESDESNDQAHTVNDGHQSDAAGDTSDRDWWLMCGCCGAAFGMVLSAAPIFVLIPLLAMLGRRSVASAVRRCLTGGMVACAVYLFTNPYVGINLFCNREVLRSNFGNSLAMYQVDRVVEGFLRAVELTVEGATWPVLLLGTIAAVGAVIRRHRVAVPLMVIALVFFVQFLLIGAGKPGEYGRFGVFTNTALAIGTACLLRAFARGVPRIATWVLTPAVVVIVAIGGGSYLWNFHADTTDDNTRSREAVRLAGLSSLLERSGADGAAFMSLHVLAEPAPYSCPPVNFSRTRVMLVPLTRVVPGANALVHDTNAIPKEVVPLPAPLLNKEGLGEVLSRAKNPPQSPLGKGGRKEEQLGKEERKQDNFSGNATGEHTPNASSIKPTPGSTAVRVRAIDQSWPAKRLALIRSGKAVATKDELRRFGLVSSDGPQSCWLRRVFTPISWANKPFEVVYTSYRDIRDEMGKASSAP